MKRCITCQLEQPEESFAFKTKHIRRGECRECYRQRWRSWYKNNKKKVQSKTAEAKIAYRNAGSIVWIKNLLGLCAHNRQIPLAPITKHNLATKLAKSLLLTPRCPYTDDLLTPGVNLALDHKMPVSRAPERAWQFKNLQWVSKRYNAAKHNMTDEEFLGFIELIRQRAWLRR